MTDELKRLYAEIAALTYSEYQRFGCNDEGTLTSCCTLRECQVTAELEHRAPPATLLLEANRCILAPHERRRCTLHICNRWKLHSSPTALLQYEALLKKLDLLLQK